MPPSFHPFETDPSARFLSGASADFGTRVHEVLRKLEWLGPEEETKRFLRDSGEKSEVLDFLETALSKPPIAHALRHPLSERTRLFREQPFLLQTESGGAPIHGIIDRAVVEYDETGVPVRAEIIDYKTDDAADPETFRSRYRRQMEMYRHAMSEFTGLPESGISVLILALRPGLAVPL